MNGNSTILRLLFSLFLLTAVLSVNAQTGTVSGVIKDDKGEVIVGANVVVEGTTVGTTTDIDGKYKLEVEQGDRTIVFSFLGMQSIKQQVKIKAGEKITLDKVLSEDALLLDDVVVVGYGRKQKRDITGSIETIKAKELTDVVVPSFESALQGRASGVQITSANGVSGSPVSIRIRGPNSISAGNQPLYVVDGIPITDGDFSPGSLGSSTNALADLNMNDIESIEILKDAAACAIYGSRGANGVVIITTKKGKSGKTSFNVNYSSGAVSPAKMAEFLDADDHLALRDRAYVEMGYDEEPKDNVVWGDETREITREMADSIANLGGSDWINKVLRPGKFQEASLSASGGNERTRFYMAGTYRSEEGFLVGNSFERLNGRINLENQATDKLKIGANISLSQTNNDRVPIGDAGGLGMAQQLPMYVPIYNEDGTYYDPYSNPLWQLENRSFNASVFRTITGIFAEYTIIPKLTFKTEFGVDVLNQIEDEFNYRNTQDPSSKSSAWDRRTNVYNWTANNYFTYSLDKFTNHKTIFTLGHAYQKSRTKGVGLYGYDFPNDYLTNPSSVDPSHMSGYGYETGYAFNSYFLRADHKIKDKYLAGVSIRTDGSSRFGVNNRYGWFPAFSAGWIISEEKFMAGMGRVSFLKLRASYGFTGNANIDDYAFLGYYTMGGSYTENPSIVPATLENEKLRWEKSVMLDVNLDYGLFENRISGSIGYYHKKSSDLLLEMLLPPTSGYYNIWMNIGEMTNSGFEFAISTKNLVKKLKWTTDINIALNKNVVTDVAGLDPDAFDNGVGGDARVIQGYSIGTAYLVEYAGVQQEDGNIVLYDVDGNALLDSEGNQQEIFVEAGTPLYYDLNGNVMTYENPTGGDFYADYNRVPVGNSLPKFIGGINNTFSYGNFDFSFLFSFVYGNDIYDDQAKKQVGYWRDLQRTEILDAYSADNTNSNIPALSLYGGHSNYVNSSRFLYDGSYIRLKTLSFGYSLSKETCKKLRLEKLRIYITGTNLLTFTKYPGWDPEVLRNTNPRDPDSNISFAAPSYATPQARVINIGVQLGF